MFSFVDRKPAYLDYAATAPVDKTVLKKAMPYLTDKFANPNSVHKAGYECRKAIEHSRQDIADYLGVDAKEIYFTSSVSESNSWVLHSIQESFCNPIVFYSKIEHDDINMGLNDLNNQFYSYYYNVDGDGNIRPNDVKECLSANAREDSTHLFILQYVNNEIGTKQNVFELCKLVKDYCKDNGIKRMYIMIDATQAIGHIPQNEIKHLMQSGYVDFFNFAGHKIGAMRGVGVLYKNKLCDMKLSNLVYGHQENGMRGSTENTAAIISMGEALKLERNNSYIEKIKKSFEDQVLEKIKGSYIVGDSPVKAPHITNICIPKCDGQQIQSMLSESGVYCSTGSACNSYETQASHVLTAIGMKEPDIHCCLRFSFSELTTPEEIDYAVETLVSHVNMMKMMSRE